MGIWLPVPLNEPIEEQDVEISFHILNHIKEHFFNIIETEEGHLGGLKKIWKKMVSGTYKKCDSCKISIFNLHFMCGSCGYMVCLHCHNIRMPQTTNQSCKHDTIELVELIPARALQFLQEQVPLHLQNFRQRSIDEHNDMFFAVYYNSLFFILSFMCLFHLLCIIRNHGKEEDLSLFQKFVYPKSATNT
jgi:hypothetical protein